MSWQKGNAFRARRSSVEADRDRCFVSIGDEVGGVGSLATEWDRESSFGVEIGERGDLGESG